MKLQFPFGAGAAALALVLAAACSPSAKDDAPLDIRGELISSPPVSDGAVLEAEIAMEPPSAEAEPVPDVALESPPAEASPLFQFDSVRVPGRGEDFLSVPFEALASFEFDIPEDDPGLMNENSGESTGQIPEEIRALDQSLVALKGFMLPLKVESGLVTEMLLMRDQSMCCFGTVPRINEWVSVRMVPRGVKAVMDVPVTVFGKLHVGEMRENGYLVGLYKMDGQSMSGPLDL